MQERGEGVAGRDKVLSAALKQIESAHGKGALMKVGGAGTIRPWHACVRVRAYV